MCQCLVKLYTHIIGFTKVELLHVNGVVATAGEGGLEHTLHSQTLLLRDAALQTGTCNIGKIRNTAGIVDNIAQSLVLFFQCIGAGKHDMPLDINILLDIVGRTLANIYFIKRL